jgi:hypothetical protein
METVTVACRFPLGLLIGINGQTARLKPAQGCAEGYSLTGVDKELAQAWFARFGHLDLVRNNLLYIVPETGVIRIPAETARKTGQKRGRGK